MMYRGILAFRRSNQCRNYPMFPMRKEIRCTFRLRLATVQDDLRGTMREHSVVRIYSPRHIINFVQPSIFDQARSSIYSKRYPGENEA